MKQKPSFALPRPLSTPRLGTFFDAALVQVGWWISVLGAAGGRYLLGPAVVVALILVRTWGLPGAVRRRAWSGILLLGVAGTAVDSLLAGLGVFELSGAPHPWLAPLWITGLWLHFATALPALAPLASRPLAAALVGAVGGPMAYGAGARLGAASLHGEPWISLLALAAVWAVALPVMLRLLLAPRSDRSRHKVALGAAPGGA